MISNRVAPGVYWMPMPIAKPPASSCDCSRYNMPFGECRDDGSVRFRLWAPAARQVELSLAVGE
jgi:1,4-alpha-glucan branching enzyme